MTLPITEARETRAIAATDAEFALEAYRRMAFIRAFEKCCSATAIAMMSAA